MQQKVMFQRILSPILALGAIVSCLFLSPAEAQTRVLASGMVDLPFSNGPGDPNFNFAVTRMHTIPVDIGATAGSQLVISLVDVNRPDQVCPDDPTGGIFEGCAVVDWPFPGRRGINLIEAQLSSGLETFHLRMGDVFSDQPEPDGP